MMLKIINDLLKELDKVISSESTMIVFTDKNYNSIALCSENFHEIEANAKINKDAELEKRKIAFIDGGNNTVVKSSNFIVSFIRLYAAVYCGKAKIKEDKHEFFAVVTADYADEKLRYKTELFPIGNALLPRIKDLVFDSMDKTITEGSNRAEIAKIVDNIRRFGELNLAASLASYLEENDIILLDGTLQATVTNENSYLNVLYDECERKKITVCGLAKTSNLFTDKGDNAQAAVNKLNSKNKDLARWYYYPFVQIMNEKHKADMFFVKFHPGSRYIFRFEVHNSLNFDLKSLFSLIAENSNDPVFPGYPYGLIEADKNARVSNEERNYMKTIIETKRNLNQYLRSLDAHDVLDNIS
ncbi:hypothetical protein GF371_00970 [Candidatus Woesearchaeota archaeon]|nr:hypothetical protein [Candidatus Woesearchaeota archaeon]